MENWDLAIWFDSIIDCQCQCGKDEESQRLKEEYLYYMNAIYHERESKLVGLEYHFEDQIDGGSKDTVDRKDAYFQGSLLIRHWWTYISNYSAIIQFIVS